MRGLVLGVCAALILLLFLRHTRPGRSLPAAWRAAGPDPVRDARIERDQEEAAYQNAVC